ncbi:hypothetical protein [Methylobacter sp.]|uniref:hypothetical protein n=1 Tax=Methylobacter sp. TaxID=2051955 RepID=UPI003DA6B97E
MKQLTYKISIGDRFGTWTVIDNASRGKYGNTCYKCECKCGHQLIISGSSLQKGRRSRCANCFHAEKTEAVKKREIGKIYNNWKIIDVIKVNYQSRTKLVAIIKHACGFEKQVSDFYILSILSPRCKKCVPIKEDSLRRYRSRKKLTT